MKKTNIFLVVSLFLSMTSVWAQEADSTDPELNLPNYTPTSPNAAALGIYGGIPVGHYTGVPDISIPLYEINLDGKTIPISLSYHASGIKVGQEASTVGLGWVLNAGGAITDNIRGGFDFKRAGNQGYFFDTGFPANPLPQDPHHLLISYRGEELNTTYGRYYEGTFDSQPDLFQFNFASFSGTMFFEKQRNNSTIAKPIIQKETQYLDVSYNTSTGDWTIVDGDGYKYQFKTYEATTYYSTTTTNYDTNLLNNNDRNGFRRGDYDVKTAWYLDKIISPRGNTVVFNYEKDTIYTPIFAREDVNYQIQFENWGGGAVFDPYYSHYTYSYSVCEQAIPTSIEFPEGHISLGYGDRLDLESSTPNTRARKLEHIQVTNKNNESIRTVEFEHGYIGGASNALSSRLMLHKVFIDGKEYKFQYNNGGLPNKNSYQTDYWGYATNAALPGDGRNFKLSPPTTFQGVFIDGLERKPNSYRSKAAVLESIEYPTGGKSVFNYELNTFQNSFYSEETRENIMNFGYITYDVDEIIPVSDEFTLASAKNAYFSVKIMNYSPRNLNTIDLILEKKQEGSSYFDSIKRFHLAEQNEDRGTLALAAGTYRIRVVNENPLGRELDIDWKLYCSTMKGLDHGAGLRIKSILDYSDSNNYTGKEYTYGNSLLMGYPVYHTDFIVYRNIDNTNPGRSWATYVNGSTDSYYPFNMSAAGHHVGYSEVTERALNPVRNEGYVVYQFRNTLNNHEEHEAFTYIRGYPIDPCLDNGLPTYVTSYNGSGQAVKRTAFIYEKDREYSIDGFTTSRLPFYDQVPYAEQTTFYIKYYQLHGERWLLKTQTDTEYFPTGNVEQQTVYTYNDKTQLTSRATTDSKGNTVTWKTLYPADISGGVYPQMTALNMINYPIEQTKWIDGKLASASLMTYSNANAAQIYLPDQVYKLENTDLLSSFTPFNGTTKDANYRDPNVKVLLYDSHGNIREMEDRAGIKTVYLWGYNYQHPVAIIQNASYETVRSVISESTINDIALNSSPDEPTLRGQLAPLHTHASLQNAQVTTYTYKPLIGVSSIKDPSQRLTYYQYDAQGRLMSVKDDQQNLVEGYEYHYKQ